MRLRRVSPGSLGRFGEVIASVGRVARTNKDLLRKYSTYIALDLQASEKTKRIQERTVSI